MSETKRVPLPLPEMLVQTGLSEKRTPAAEAMRNASFQAQLIEDYRPVAESLECRLSSLHWLRQGVLPFVEGRVPFLVNNNGRLSANAAALFFARCQESASHEDRIAVLELGAGTGLFARYFLDEFRLLCERESRDFYQRLSYYVTDRSPRTVEQWEERGIFREHGGHAIITPCDASEVRRAGVTRVHAAFCNYLLDVLPAAVMRETEQGWEQLAIKTSLSDDAGVLRQYTALSLDQIRELVASSDPESQGKLLPLLPLLEIEGTFLPAGDRLPPGLEPVERVPGGAPFAYNYGAIECLESLLGVLEPNGFVLVTDYGAPAGESGAPPSAAQRFGTATAMGLNFPLLERHFERCGVTLLKPQGDGGSGIHTRLLLREALPATSQVFGVRFAAGPREHADAPIAQARHYAARSHLRRALTSYRIALERNPRDWQLIGEAAAFVSGKLKDHAAGLELAREALELNPWYSAWLWNVLGDCLRSLNRTSAALEAYLQAARIYPDDVQTNLNLAQSWWALGDPRRSLEAVARGLANDSNAMFRHLLLERQQQAMAALTVRWDAERETLARRRE